MRKKGKAGNYQRLLAWLLAVVLFVGVVPANGGTVYAAGVQNGQKLFDYQRMESLQGNRRALAVNYQTYGQYMIFSPMMRGERVVLQYSMPENGLMNASVYRWDKMAETGYEYATQYKNGGFLPNLWEWEELKRTQEDSGYEYAKGKFLGYLYGLPYYGHLSISEDSQIGLTEDGWRYEKVYDEIDARMKDETVQERTMKRFMGVGIDGKGAKLRMVSTYGLTDEVSLVFAEAQEKERAIVTEEAVSGGDPENLLILPATDTDTVSTGDTVSMGDGMPAGEPAAYSMEVTSMETVTQASFTHDYALHNYMGWRGKYVSDQGKVKTLEPGTYLLVFEYADKDKATDRSITRFLPIEIKGVNGSGSQEEERREYLSDMLMTINGYPTLARIQWGDPVDLQTGALLWNHTDLYTGGSQSELSFERNYNSTATENKDMGMGRGWTYSYLYHIRTLITDAVVTLPEGGQICFQMAADGSYQTREKGNAYRLRSLDDGYLLSDENGREVAFDAKGNARTITEADGTVTHVTMEEGRLLKVTRGGSVLSFTWKDGHLSEVADQNGRKTGFGYQGEDLTSVTDTDGNTLRYTYDDRHNLLTVTDFNGSNRMANTYDDGHRVLSQQMNGQSQDTFRYDDANRVNTFTDGSGMTSRIHYDEKGRILWEENDAGRTSYEYDDRNRKISETDKKGNCYRYLYDGDSSRISSMIFPDGTTNNYTYNGKGQLEKVTDALGPSQHTPTKGIRSAGSPIPGAGP